MVRLISGCTIPTVAAKKHVVAPIRIMNVRVAGANSSNGDIRAIRNTPAVTIVAA